MIGALRSVLKTACCVVVSATILPIPGFCQWQSCGMGQCVQSSNVGTGTSTPAAPLQVVGSNDNYIALFQNPSGNSLLTVVGGAPYNTAELNLWYSGLPNSPANPVWRIGHSGTGGRLDFYQWTGSANVYAMSVLPDGAVGIGTSDPCNNAASASVPNCKLSVNGGIQAQAVVVNSNWSDYVFAPDYRLAPLSEVAGYIKDNHHLPGIPSESEVQQSGVSLGDMQSKLLAKIEELTLHMIAADEENHRLRERVAKLETAAGAQFLGRDAEKGTAK